MGTPFQYGAGDFGTRGYSYDNVLAASAAIDFGPVLASLGEVITPVDASAHIEALFSVSSSVVVAVSGVISIQATFVVSVSGFGGSVWADNDFSGTWVDKNIPAPAWNNKITGT